MSSEQSGSLLWYLARNLAFFLRWGGGGGGHELFVFITRGQEFSIWFMILQNVLVFNKNYLPNRQFVFLIC